jgi:hypothetical protein
MFVGHGLLAFAIAAWIAHAWGHRRDRAFAIGVLAAAFASAPDVDMLYVPIVLVDRLSIDPNEFWGISTIAHRTVTHSLVAGSALAGAVGLWSFGTGTETDDGTASSRSRLLRLAAVCIGCALVVLTFIQSGRLVAALMALFAATTLGITMVAQRFAFQPRVLTGAALIGLLTHPFGDLFTGTPPPLFYPLDVSVFTGVVTLHPDPTLHLLGAFAIELSTAWLALLVFLRIDGRRFPHWQECVAGRGGLGVGYAAVAPLLPAPTLDESYQFVFSVLVLGIVLGASARGVCRQPLCLVGTGLVTVTLAWAAYLAVYVGLL